MSCLSTPVPDKIGHKPPELEINSFKNYGKIDLSDNC